jgi:hypothetical protein
MRRLKDVTTRGELIVTEGTSEPLLRCVTVVILECALFQITKPVIQYVRSFPFPTRSDQNLVKHDKTYEERTDGIQCGNGRRR